MLEQELLTRLVEAGAIATSLFLIWQIIIVIFKFFGKNEEGNQAEKGGLYRILTDLLSNVSGVIAKNSEVLTDMKIFLATEMVRQSDIRRVETLINIRADVIEAMIRKAHPETDLDDTLPIDEKPLDSFED